MMKARLEGEVRDRSLPPSLSLSLSLSLFLISVSLAPSHLPVVVGMISPNPRRCEANKRANMRPGYVKQGSYRRS